MTTPIPAPARPSPSGARLTGDDLQHLVVWYWCLKALSPGSGVVSVAVEADAAGAVDDVVVRFADGQVLYLQVKASVSAAGLANIDWFTAPSRSGGPSLLERLYRSWCDLGRPSGGVALLTSRPLDPGDPLLTGLDRTSRVALHLRRAEDKPVKEVRTRLAGHLGCDEAELCAFFDVLQIDVGQVEALWRQRVGDVAAAAGVCSDEAAVGAALGEIRNWVKTTRDPRSSDEILEAVNRLGLRASPSRALVIVQALRRSPSASDALLALDWVDLLDGESPETRRGLTNPTDWDAVLAPQLREMSTELRARGETRVLVGGDMRLPAWFAVGSTLREVAGFDVAALYHGDVWPAEAAGASHTRLQVLADESLSDGTDLALVVAVSHDGTLDARRTFGGVPDMGRLVTLTVEGGPHRRALGGSADAMAAAVAIRDWARAEARVPRVHLVLLAPAPFALFLGHLWDRIAPTTIYEDLGSSYQASFSIR